jgi:hypothetical protein
MTVSIKKLIGWKGSVEEVSRAVDVEKTGWAIHRGAGQK